jgi:hypothetical protein
MLPRESPFGGGNWTGFASRHKYNGTVRQGVFGRYRRLSTADKERVQTDSAADTRPGPESWHVERAAHGSILVRVPSKPINGRPLPDAVFTFRKGDPQYEYWEEQLRSREVREKA